MRNYEIVRILNEIAMLLEMDNVQFKPRAYEKAARSIEALEEEAEDIYGKGGLKALMGIPGVGKSIAEKIEELLKSGKLEYYDTLKKKVPVDLESLSKIEGMGPKTIKELYEQLGVKNMDDLEKVAQEHRISKLPGFKEKTEQNILKGIEFAKKGKGRFILGFILPQIREIEGRLRSVPGVSRVVASGSVRRWKETIGDADFLVISKDAAKVMDFFVSMPDVVDVISKGTTKSTVKLKNGLDADIRVLQDESFGAALQYFTGGKDHNVALRRIAQEKGLKLSEYGLFKENLQVAGRTEEEVYEKLGLDWMPPELRENTGEIEAAVKHSLPKLVEYKDLHGDTQAHTKWTDGANSIKEMALEAKKMGLSYIVISDHSKGLAMTGGLDEKMLLKQAQEIEETNKELSGIRILKGVELNIQKNGSLDISDDALKNLDVVGGAVHSNLNLPKDEMTERILKALENPNLDILCHPTERQIQKREAVQLDVEQVISKAKDTGTVLDIDSYPDRLDLKDEYIKKAVQSKAKLGISSDAHSTLHLHYLELGVAQARRGWATAENIVNTRKVEEFLKMLK
ncbi:MAG: DNA polymerase/3'-5' exonuclease PolX [Promethearchaeati archaeon SRVP18_Atabeyarchaeia-1]